MNNQTYFQRLRFEWQSLKKYSYGFYYYIHVQSRKVQPTEYTYVKREVIIYINGIIS